MGIIETMLGGLSGAHETTHPQLPSVLQGLLAPELGDGEAAPGLALTSVLQRLEQAGLGSVVQSWLGDGPNQPIEPDQLNAALGPERVQSMAARAGLPVANFLGVLAEHLPGLVHRLSPDGRLLEAAASPPGNAAA